jgi:DNA replication protein DnaC
MRGLTEEAAAVAIDVATRVLHLPTVRASADELAAAAVRVTHRAYLAELLSAEVDDREGRRRERRIAEARFPRTKRLSEFDLGATPSIAPATLAALATGDWIIAGEPVVLLGDSGTGKTHVLIGLGIAACERGMRVRYVTAAALVNELVEAEDERELSKVIGRYGRVDLLCLDELGYLHLDRRGAELLFQVLTERDERASIAVASNAPFSEWGQTFTDPRLAGAVVDRLTFRAHILETGTSSYRLRTSQGKRREGPPAA